MDVQDKKVEGVEVNLMFNSNDEIFSAFHCIMALNTGGIAYDVFYQDFGDTGHNQLLFAPEAQVGKKLSVTIKDTCQSFSHECEPCLEVRGESTPFSFELLKKKTKEQWTPLDFEIAKKIIDCYGNFVIQGTKYYHEDIQLGKARLMELKDVLKAKKSNEWISEKIAYLIREEGKDPKQAAAIAYSMAGRSKKMKKSLIAEKIVDLIKGLINDGASKDLIEEVLKNNFLNANEFKKSQEYSNDLFGMVENEYVVKAGVGNDCIQFEESRELDLNDFKGLIKTILQKTISKEIEDLQKAKVPVGTVHQWQGKPYKKVKNGEWVLVKEGNRESKNPKNSPEKAKDLKGMDKVISNAEYNLEKEKQGPKVDKGMVKMYQKDLDDYKKIKELYANDDIKKLSKFALLDTAVRDELPRNIANKIEEAYRDFDSNDKVNSKDIENDIREMESMMADYKKQAKDISQEKKDAFLKETDLLIEKLQSSNNLPDDKEHIGKYSSKKNSSSKVSVNTSSFEGSHGKKPSGRGGWAFEIDRNKEPMWFNGSFSDGLKAAKKQAKSKVKVLP